jgi:hypothetical protein
MKLEPRYVVLKLKDMKAAGVTMAETTSFNVVCDKVTMHRLGAGKGMLECLVIEKDWPEYEPTLAMLEARVDGHYAPANRQNLEALATSLRNAVVAMRAFTDQQGNMPEDTGEFRDLKAALFDAEAVLSDVPADHQCCGACNTPEADNDVAKAIATLTAAVKADPDYAWGWHCNIAMSAVDAGCPHQVANEGAARFMSLLFGVNTREHPVFPKPDATEPRPPTTTSP